MWVPGRNRRRAACFALPWFLGPPNPPRVPDAPSHVRFARLCPAVKTRPMRPGTSRLPVLQLALPTGNSSKDLPNLGKLSSRYLTRVSPGQGPPTGSRERPFCPIRPDSRLQFRLGKFHDPPVCLSPLHRPAQPGGGGAAGTGLRAPVLREGNGPTGTGPLTGQASGTRHPLGQGDRPPRAHESPVTHGTYKTSPIRASDGGRGARTAVKRRMRTT